MGWIALAILAAAVGIILLILLTDGRYFGKPLMRWVYDRAGPALFGSASEAARWQTLAQELALAGDKRVLDVGTAVGDLPLTLAALPGYSGRVVGVDWSPRMIAAALERAQKRGLHERVTFQVVDVREGLPFRDGEYDVVCCLGLLETLPHPEPILEELCRVLAPGGTLVLSLYRGWASTSVALSLKWYREHLATLGLTELRVAACRRNQDVVLARLPRQRFAIRPKSPTI
jgi:ubiquinone/menaquinone biosynthesis C-methylase UbiE